MKKKYYDKWEFDQIVALNESNPIESKKRFEKYMEKYPEDIFALPYYASVLILLGDLESAEKILNSCEILNQKKFKYTGYSSKMKAFRQVHMYGMIKLLSYQEKYKELYEFYMQNKEEIENTGIINIFEYIKKKNGLLKNKLREGKSYILRQITDYREDEFLEHIKKRLPKYLPNSEKTDNNIFSIDFPDDIILEEIKKYIPSNKCLYWGFCEDVYIFKYDYCGKDNNKTVNYFKVVCFHGTNQYITMVPCAGCENLPYIDLNYINSIDSKPKVKKLSQIEKFNLKYNKN